MQNPQQADGVSRRRFLFDANIGEIKPTRGVNSSQYAPCHAIDRVYNNQYYWHLIFKNLAMKIKDMRIIYGGLILLFVGVIAISLFQLYKNMGGMDEVKIEIAPAIKRNMVGKTFKTRYTDKKIEEHFLKCRSLIENKKISGDLIVITYLQDSIEGNYVEQFVGIALAEDVAEIPVDFDMLEYQSKQRYLASLNMHPLVRPTPEQIEERIYERAQTEKNTLRPFIMETHHQDNSLTLEAWVE